MPALPTLPTLPCLALPCLALPCSECLPSACRNQGAATADRQKPTAINDRPRRSRRPPANGAAGAREKSWAMGGMCSCRRRGHVPPSARNITEGRGRSNPQRPKHQEKSGQEQQPRSLGLNSKRAKKQLVASPSVNPPSAQRFLPPSHQTTFRTKPISACAASKTDPAHSQTPSGPAG